MFDDGGSVSHIHPRLRAVLSLTWLLCLLSPRVVYSAESPRKIALLVGISDYFDKNMEDLEFAENDVDVVAEKLQRLGFDTTLLTGRNASQNNIHAVLNDFFEKTAKLENDSIVFLMFSGHGQELPVNEVEPESGVKIPKDIPFFCPRDAKPYRADKHEIEGKTVKELAEEFKLISLNEITRRLERESNSTRNLLVVDACRNTPGSGKAVGVTKTARNLAPGIRILFSAKGGQKSWESTDDKIRHGVMSHYLIQGLDGAARNRRDQITWSRLVNYVREEVEFAGWQLAGGRDRKQNPHVIMNSFDTIILGTPPLNFSWLSDRVFRDGLEGFTADLELPKFSGLRRGLELSKHALTASLDDDRLLFQLRARNMLRPNPLLSSILDSRRPSSGEYRVLTPTMDQIGGNLRVRLHGPTSDVKSVAFSPDGRFIASGDRGDRVRVWDAETLQPHENPLFGHTDDVNSVRFSPDGTKLVTGGNDNQAIVFELNDLGKTFVRSYRLSKAFDEPVTRVSVSRDGKMAAARIGEKQCYIWSLETGDKIKQLTAKGRNKFRTIEFSPYDNVFAAGMHNGKIGIWNTGHWEDAWGFTAHDSFVEDLAFAPDGKHLFSSGVRTVIKKWRIDIRGGRRVNTLRAHADSVRAIACSPDGKYLASHSDDGMLYVWNAVSGKRLGSIYSPNHWQAEIDFSPDSRVIATGSKWGGRAVKLWNVDNLRFESKPTGPHRDIVRAVVFDKRGRMYTASDDKAIKIWNASNQQIIRTLNKHTGWIYGLAISPDDRMLASASGDKTVILWSLPAGRSIRTWNHAEEVRAVAFSADGSLLATAGEEKVIHIWNVNNGTLKTKLTGHSDTIVALAYSPDGRQLASAGYDNSIRIWNAEASTLEAEISRSNKSSNYHTGNVYGLAYSPDSRRLVSCSSDDKVFVWNTRTFELSNRLFHDNTARRATFDPTGTRIITTGFDRRLRFWEVETGRLQLSYQFDSLLCGVASNGQYVAAGDGEGRVHILESTR